MSAVLFTALLAATPITLGQVREQTRNNLQALNAELERVRASGAVTSAGGALLPQLGVTAQGLRTWNSKTDTPFVSNGRVIDGSGAFNTFSLAASLTQVLFDLNRWSVYRQSGDLETAARGQAKEQMLASEFEGLKRFYALLTAEKQLTVLESTAAKSLEFTERAEALFQAGRGTKGDSLAAQVNLGTDRINAVKQRAVVVQAQADLSSWVGQSEVVDWTAVDPRNPEQPPPAGVSMGSALETARTQRPLLAALAAQVRAAEAFTRSQQAGFLPRLQLQAGYARQSGSFTTAFGDFSVDSTVNLGVSLQWDLFNGFSTVGQVRQARALESEARNNLAQNERDVSGQIRIAFESLRDQLEALAVARSNLQAAQQGLEFFQERFRAGASSTLDIRDAQVKLEQAALVLIQTRADVEVARAALERAMGTLGNGART